MDAFTAFVAVWILGLVTVAVVVAFVVTLTSDTYHYGDLMDDLGHLGPWVLAGAGVVAARVLRPLRRNGDVVPVSTTEAFPPKP